ncbi:MAG: isochorismatase family protein [Synergistaceae bacterium]|jgi:nicotinamidase-related amidase|nr:isochorismatase family protein [Synergistaceae bacterium]
MSNDALVIVDPQNDFCDKKGSLYVDGAEDDILRLSKYIETTEETPREIFVSLDSHDRVAIFHPSFWVNPAGRHPEPFTPITPASFAGGDWRPAASQNRPFAEQMFSVMKTRGIPSLMLWPEHCVVSTWGHQIADPLQRALETWRGKTGLAARYVFKGENPFTDQFSIFEGLDDSWPETAFNTALFARLEAFDRVTFGGEALSHCVRESILSYVKRPRSRRQEVRLLQDCTSPVSGFDAKESLDLLRREGVTFITAAS